MHFIVKVYLKDGRLLYALNTTDLGQAHSHFYGAARMNAQVGKTEFYIDGLLNATRE